MSDILTQHPPAVKVGGRRLSASRPRRRSTHHRYVTLTMLILSLAHLCVELSEQPQTETVATDDADEPTDYPRPNPPAELIEGDQRQPNHVEHEHARYEEEMPKNEKRQQQEYEVVGRLKFMKHNGNRPTRDNVPVGGIGRRIDQPAGRGFDV